MRCLILFSLACLAATARAQEWSRFRGPNGSGVGVADSVPLKWSETDFNWKITVPGGGHGSPVLWGDKIFLLSGHEPVGGAILLCLNAEDGTQQWRKNLPFPAWRHHELNSLASSTPAVDAERVYISWFPSHTMLAAYTHQGEKVWEYDVGNHQSQHGPGASPMVYKDLVVFANEHNGVSRIVALDAATGKMRWETPRRSVRTAYCTPCVYEPENGKPQLLFTSQAHGIYALDPMTGQPLWEYGDAFDKRSASSPVIAGPVILGACGSGAGGNYVVAVRPPDSSTDKPELAYEVRRSAPYVPTSVVVGDLAFLWSDGGIVTCIDTATGKTHYQERVGGTFYASPIAFSDRVMNISTTGEVTILKASDKFEILARNDLGEKSHATAAVAGGRLYIRTFRHLYSLGGMPAASGK